LSGETEEIRRKVRNERRFTGQAFGYPSMTSDIWR